MPAKINIGFSRKIGESNYGSRGATANLEVEIDSGTISDSQLLRDRMRSLYAMARQSVEEELGLESEPAQFADERPPKGNGRPNGSANRDSGTLTSSQQRAIFAIARKHRLDPNSVVQERFHLSRVEDLSIRQASEMIDALKKGMAEVRT